MDSYKIRKLKKGPTKTVEHNLIVPAAITNSTEIKNCDHYRVRIIDPSTIEVSFYRSDE